MYDEVFLLCFGIMSTILPLRYRVRLFIQDIVTEKKYRFANHCRDVRFLHSGRRILSFAQLYEGKWKGYLAATQAKAHILNIIQNHIGFLQLPPRYC